MGEPTGDGLLDAAGIASAQCRTPQEFAGHSQLAAQDRRPRWHNEAIRAELGLPAA